jgi:hypothetical protein
MAPAAGAALGAAARARVVADYDWAANLAPFARLIEEGGAAHARAG